MPTIRPFAAIAAALAALPCAAAAEQVCGAADGWESASFAGEAYGDHSFAVEAGPNVIVLAPTDHGWRIEMVDDQGLGLPVFAPPLRPVETNPLNIAGWHFRNAANTGPNRGDVNAPQTIRKFAYGALAVDPAANPELIAPGAPQTAAPSYPPERSGRGELIVEDYGLADLEPGERARMVWMEFSGCVEWDPGPREPTLADLAAPGIAFPEIIETMTDCGLDARTYRLSDRMGGGAEGGAALYLTPDMDGDGAGDLVVPIDRLSDMAPGLAICLADRTLVLAGFDGRIGQHLDPVYFGRADWWNVHERRQVYASPSEDGPPPVLRGEAITIGKEGASSVLVYLDDDLNVASYWQGD